VENGISRYRQVVDNDRYRSFYTTMPPKLRLAALTIACACAPSQLQAPPTPGVDVRTSETEYDALNAQADSADLLLISAYASPRECPGTVEAKHAFSGFVEKFALSGKPIIVLSFGSPYLLSAFPISWPPSLPFGAGIHRAPTRM